MIKIFIFVILLIPYCCFGKKNTSFDTPLVEELMSLSNSSTLQNVFDLLKQIDNSELVNKEDVYKKFLLQNGPYCGIAVRYLYTSEDSTFGSWLNNNSSSISSFTWSEISKMSMQYGRTKKNDLVWKLLFKALKKTLDDDTRHEILFAFRYNAISQECLLLKDFISKENFDPCRIDIFVIISRYKNPQLDSITKQCIVQWKDPIVTNGLIKHGLMSFTRYDFLPELHMLKNKLSKIKEIEKIDDAKESLVIINNVISKLELKKQENAPIGLPLDWPKGVTK